MGGGPLEMSKPRPHEEGKISKRERLLLHQEGKGRKSTENKAKKRQALPREGGTKSGQEGIPS